jgi:hypothetical protein
MIGKAGLFGNRLLGPADISNLTGWWDASDASTLLAADNSAASAGGSVATMNDKSGSGRHFGTTSASERPIRQTGVKNGLDVLRFDGSNDNMAIGSAVVNAAASTVFVVAAASSISAGTWANIQWNPVVLHGTNSHGYFAVRSTGTVHAYGFDGNFDDSSLAYTEGDWLVFSAIHDGSTLTARANGVDAAGVAHGTSSPGGTTRLGQSGIEFFQGDVGEVVTYSVALSTEQRDSLELYLRSKWGI